MMVFFCTKTALLNISIMQILAYYWSPILSIISCSSDQWFHDCLIIFAVIVMSMNLIYVTQLFYNRPVFVCVI